MARFSTRTMNNVVIFAMLAMIALFNLDSFLPSPDSRQALQVIGSDDYVLRIEHNGNSLEKAGQQWRQVTQTSDRLNVTPNAQLTAWRQAVLAPVSAPDEINQDEAQIVVIWLAGQTQGRVLALYQKSDILLVKFRGSWYRLQQASLHELLPWWQPVEE
ncbi:hypothetical protein [Alteromonas halophila]|uniref:Uncharacterized protein n=1 Tax=Alteromonas halophila TaxID=516698 RepID=A0A918MYA5_9ALTE|nr:hypothetical protein [Alteromonas halophila]GGW85172.1 hypothetical protein GCM10007391_18820 [Alteromonas halophila]